MKLSAKNVIKGKVKAITAGAVNAEVAIEVGPGVVIYSMITKSSLESLGLKLGSEAYAVIKSSHVILAVD